MAWHNTIERIRPYIVKIETPQGHGTGFFFAKNSTGAIVAIATAAHVVEQAERWRYPIEIRTETDSAFLEDKERVIFIDSVRDSAVITIAGDVLKLPANTIKLCEQDKYMAVGSAIGWLGFPSIAPDTCCFFRGYVSAFEESYYLVDGVAINGVSGGPVFIDHEKPEIIGLVSSYFPNRQLGDTLPGLLRCQDVTKMHDIFEDFRNFDEARKAKEEQREDSSLNR